MPPANKATGKRPAPPDGLFRVGHLHLVGSTGQLRWMNNAARQLRQEGVPFTPRDLEKHPLQTSDGRAVQGADLPLIRAWREGKPQEGAFVLVREDGTAQSVHWSASPLLDDKGAVAEVFATVVVGPPEPDWQELAGLAHDLRTPLQSMQLFSALLESSGELPDEVREVTDVMRAAADRASAIARKLLEWCRSPAEASRPGERSLFPLKPFLTSLAEEHTASARGKSLNLVCRCEAVEGWEVCTDRVKLGRLLSNLLTNAIRYTTNGRVEFTAEWRELAPTRKDSDPFASSELPRQRKPSLVLSVVDTGVGISSEEQEAIFQPFERGRTAEQSDASGSGVGLTIVERLIEELGLSLEVYSVFGQGSAFDLVIPPRMLSPIQEAQPTP